MKDGASQPAYRERYKLLFGGLVSVMGKSLREEVEREELLVKRCHNLAELIKDARGENRVSRYTLCDAWVYAWMLSPCLDFIGVYLCIGTLYTKITHLQKIGVFSHFSFLVPRRRG